MGVSRKKLTFAPRLRKKPLKSPRLAGSTEFNGPNIYCVLQENKMSHKRADTFEVIEAISSPSPGLDGATVLHGQ